MVPVIIYIISTVLNVVLAYSSCPKALHTNMYWIQGSICTEKYWYRVYEQMYTRASPYGFGIMASHVFLNDEEFKSKVWIEYVAFAFLVVSSNLGVYPT